MPQGNGGVVGPANDPTTSTASGVWGLKEHAEAVGAGEWPGPIVQYQIQRSLRFNSADSAYLSRTPASAGNRKTWTWSAWVKRSEVSSVYDCLFSTGYSGNNYIVIWYRNDLGGQLQIQEYNSGINFEIRTTAVYRDTSAWFHIVFAFDSTQTTNTDRMKLYINGELYSGSTEALTWPTQNYDGLINSTNTHSIGRNQPYANGYHRGYMAEVHFVDGQALAPSDFGETDLITGVWSPIAYTGTYGTNGFYLDFSDNSGTTSTTLGADSSGNGNNWTPNNFSVTAGAGNDSLVDTPTQYGDDTGAGGEVRGNYCTLNPLANAGLTLSNGNLDFTSTVSNRDTCIATHAVSSGKWYWEYTVSSNNYSTAVGIEPAGYYPAADARTGFNSAGYAWWLDRQQKYHNGSGSGTSYGAAVSSDAVIGVALDLDGGSLTFYLNGSTQGSAYTGISGTYLPSICDCADASTGGSSGVGAGSMNFGQRPFAYTAPSGFKALVTTNLPEPTVVQGDDYFNTVLWTGDNVDGRAITGVGFAPDFAWIKARSAAYVHALQDTVRGAGAILFSNLTNAEDTSNGGGSILSFDSDGFSLDNGTVNNTYVNNSGTTYVAWNWNAGGSNASNTDGTITSTVRANTTAGISIVTYTGNNVAGATVGHGLGVIPSIVICKARSTSGNPWIVWHNKLSGPSYYLLLNSTAAQATNTNMFNNTLPTSSVFSLGSNVFSQNQSGQTFVAYCFAEVPGFSAFGNYTGNGSADGPFVYTGFRPAFVVFKGQSTIGNWKMVDSTRSAYNLTDDQLSPNLSNAESVDNGIDILSNGFRLRSTATATNGSGQTFIYMAFAENPFKNALAR